MAGYPNGTPSWIELSVPDPAAAVGFYTELFGWSAGEPSAAGGGYQMFFQAETPVAGLMPTQDSSQPVAWATYVSVDDADATVAAVQSAGGQVLVEPMDVMDLGRMAFIADPTGAAVGLWQAAAFAGAGLVNQPVSFVWSDVLTHDKAAVLDFYGAVFGWTGVDPTFTPNGGYVVFERPDGGAIGGTMEMTEEWFAPGTPPHWAVTFAVADADVIVARALELGASAPQPGMDCPIGRFATLIDPQGAEFSVMASAGG